MSDQWSGPERLRVYHLAQDLARAVDDLLRRGRVRSWLADQLGRAASSVVLNISEGAGHFTPARKAFHYRIARAEANECIGILTRALQHTRSPDLQSARRTANMICTLLTALIKAQERRLEEE